jgi:hypothetical protein
MFTDLLSKTQKETSWSVRGFLRYFRRLREENAALCPRNPRVAARAAFPKGRATVPEDTAMLFPKCRLIVPEGANAVPERSMVGKRARCGLSD